MIWDINICTSCDSQRLPVSIVWPCDFRLGVNTCLTDLSCWQYLPFGCWMFFASSWVITSRNVFQNELGLILNVDEITDPVWQGLCYILKTAIFVFPKFILRLFRAQEKTSSHLSNFCEGKHKATFCWSSLILIFHGSHPRNVNL